MYRYITLELKECKCISNDDPFEIGIVYDYFELPQPEYVWLNECKKRIYYCVIYRKNEKNYYATYLDYEFNHFFKILKNENENDNKQILGKVSNIKFVEENNDNINIYR